MNTRSIVLTALFAALISVGAYIAVPVGPVPITLQTLFILVAGLLGGRKAGLSAVFLYLVAGAIGLPVFSGATGGIAHIAGPTGGFLLGSLLSVFLAGACSDLARGIKEEDARIRTAMLFIAGALAGSVSIYLVGLPWLKISLELSWQKTFAAGLLPFIPGDLLKTASAAAVSLLSYRRIDDLLRSR